MTLPCPRCERPHNISHCLHGARVLCRHCGHWATVVIRIDSSLYLAPVAPPEYPRPARREEAW